MRITWTRKNQIQHLLFGYRERTKTKTRTTTALRTVSFLPHARKIMCTFATLLYIESFLILLLGSQFCTIPRFLVSSAIWFVVWSCIQCIAQVLHMCMRVYVCAVLTFAEAEENDRHKKLEQHPPENIHTQLYTCYVVCICMCAYAALHSFWPEIGSIFIWFNHSGCVRIVTERTCTLPSNIQPIYLGILFNKKTNIVRETHTHTESIHRRGTSQ